ncbi:MAG: DUF4114 domain-containing protein [Phycisphaerales bacterium]|nr:DUF4114 domain-containing protein [Phycisphaerales bacterium]
MKRLALLSAAVVVTLLGASAAQAGTLKGSAGNGWQDFPTTLNNYTVVKGIPVSNDPNRPFWDNPSSDISSSQGGPFNIGNYLVTPPSQRFITSRVNVPGAGLTNLQWWGNTGSYSSNFDPNMCFTQGYSTADVYAQMLMQSAGGANRTIVGWYNIDDPSQLNVIWNGKSINNDPITPFQPTGDWGFYLQNSSGKIFYMDASLNTIDMGNQHFAVFMDTDNSVPGGEVYYIGIEDSAYGTPKPEGNGDFNDFVLKVWFMPGGNPPPPPPGIPEPASLTLLGAGVVGLLIRRKR